MKEVIDPNSGAILFKADDADLSIEQLIQKIKSLEKKIETLEKITKELTDKKGLID